MAPKWQRFVCKYGWVPLIRAGFLSKRPWTRPACCLAPLAQLTATARKPARFCSSAAAQAPLERRRSPCFTGAALSCLGAAPCCSRLSWRCPGPAAVNSHASEDNIKKMKKFRILLLLLSSLARENHRRPAGCWGGCRGGLGRLLGRLPRRPGEAAGRYGEAAWEAWGGCRGEARIAQPPSCRSHRLLPSARGDSAATIVTFSRSDRCLAHLAHPWILGWTLES